MAKHLQILSKRATQAHQLKSSSTSQQGIATNTGLQTQELQANSRLNIERQDFWLKYIQKI